MDVRHLILIVAGALIILIGFVADITGVGMAPETFGWMQMTFIALGGVVVVSGLVLRVKSKVDTKDSTSDDE